MRKKIEITSKNLFWGIIIFLILSNSGVPSLKFSETVRVDTRWIEFDYVTWTIETIWRKVAQVSIGTHRYLNERQQKEVVEDYFNLINHQREVREKINNIYVDPEIENPDLMAEPYLAEQRAIQSELHKVGYLFEGILQSQVSFSTSVSQLAFLQQPFPPVQYHTTSLPYALIVSPRNEIRQVSNISLLPDLTLDQIVHLENSVEQRLDVSALVVEIGGVGVYPTMVMETNNLTWLAEVVSHEWTHNFLTLRPLGLLYDQTPEIRTINETTASIAGKELGNLIIEYFYPILKPKPTIDPVETVEEVSIAEESPDAFDFRAEMRETRVTVDDLLTQGKIEEAEAYMEDRRILFVHQGFNIRRLNQAYFAFHGAYADQPGGAAGEDPVGEAVRTLRSQSPSLADFVKRIAWVTSFERLQKLVAP